MKETIELGPTPYGEDCAQVGADDYYERAPLECKTYIKQLKRQYEAEHKASLPEGCKLYTKENAHDYGTYHEVAVKFESLNEVAGEAAYWLEGNLPEFWDEESKTELKK